MKIDPSLTLDSVLDGELPLSDTPHKLERPGYKREGLYGPTPFTPRGDPILIALTIEQHCRHCGHSWLSFGGIFREFEGTALMGEARFRNAVKDATKDKIEKVQHLHEEVPYCPHCLGMGDAVSVPANLGTGEDGTLQPLPLFDAQVN